MRFRNHWTGGQIPDFIDPKLPVLTQVPPEGRGWLHELKLDGYRMHAHWGVDRVWLLTRSGIDWTSRFPQVAGALSKPSLQGTIIDGELVAIDVEGKSDFSKLQNAGFQKATIVFFAFDLLFDRNRDMRALPLLQRKLHLKDICNGFGRSQMQFLDHIHGDPGALIQRCKSLGLEGIVSKRVDRPYDSGRSSDWLKTKFRYRENLVVGGFEVSGNLSSLSSLLLGYFDEPGKLIFAGRAGTGWSLTVEAELIKKFNSRKSTKSPFAGDIPRSKVIRNTVTQFIDPLLVVEVGFGSWTENKQLRHAAFHALREEVESSSITSENIFADQQPTVEKPQQEASLKRPASKPLPGLSNQQRVLYPQDQLTKVDVAAYLFQVSQWLLPQIVNRPISLLRCTETIEGEQFFQRHPSMGFPSQIDRIDSIGADPLICIPSADGLLATVQILAIELHPWSCLRDRMDRADRIIFDLDPDVRVSFSTVIEGALIVREELLKRGLHSFVKTTGGKGLHIVVPIVRRYDWSQVFEYSKALAQALERTHQKLFVANMSKARRKDRIFIDYHRNKQGATAIAAYSLRARPGATVATPITWEELPTIRPEAFTLTTVPTRLKRLLSDPWEGIAKTDQRLGF